LHPMPAGAMLSTGIMKLFFNRTETAGEIVFEFHYTPVATFVFFLGVAAMLVPGCPIARRVLRRCGVLLLLWMVGLLPAWLELEEAMRKGPVSVSGSKFSFSNPLKIVIAKR